MINTYLEEPLRRGYLLPIGGAEDKIAKRLILRRFVQLCGESSACIAVIPSASEIPDEVGPMYHGIFTALGVPDVRVLDIRSREAAFDPASLTLLDGVTGVFMTGGDQLRLATLLGGTPIGDRLLELFHSGVTVAGTSAGASAMSHEMIAAGQSGIVPSQSLVEMARGLGFIEHVIIDQHFRQRQRIGRLMTVVTLHPSLIGIGVDEDTALVIAPDNSCEVIGSGSVTIVDGSRLAYTDVHKIAPDRLVSVLGATVHILTQGYRYQLDTRQPFPANGVKG
jgi:cyanophycinase